MVVVCTDPHATRAEIGSLFGVNILATVVADDTKVILDELATWFAEIRSDLKLAFAANFDWMRRHIAKEAINNTAMQNGAIGLVLIIPGADLPVMTLNQAKMILQIAAAYGQHMNKDRVKELAAVVGGGFAFRSIARTAIGFVPVLGWVIRGVVGYSGTLAMGYAALEYFERGGSPEGLAVKLQEVRDGLVMTAQKGRDALPVEETKEKMKALPEALEQRKERAAQRAAERAARREIERVDRPSRRDKRNAVKRDKRTSGYHTIA